MYCIYTNDDKAAVRRAKENRKRLKTETKFTQLIDFDICSRSSNKWTEGEKEKEGSVMGSRSRAGKAETKTKTTGMPLKAINCKLKRMPETARAKGERREELGYMAVIWALLDDGGWWVVAGAVGRWGTGDWGRVFIARRRWRRVARMPTNKPR